MMNYTINKTENGVLHDKVQRLHRGASYFQSSTQFYSICVNTTSFTPTRKVQPSLHPFSQNPQLLNSVICRPHTRFHLNWAICGKYRQLFIYASKWRTATHLSIFIKLTITQQILWKTPVPNFTQIWWKIWKNSHNATLRSKYHV